MEPLPSLPLELIESLIINSAISWLRVSKRYNALAINYITNEPTFLEDPKSAVCNAITSKNYALLDVLLSDERYRANYILSQAMNICPKDKSVNTSFLKHCFEVNWIRLRIFNQAVQNDWIDLVEYILENIKAKLHIESLAGMSARVFELLIRHPKLYWADKFVEEIATNNKILAKEKLLILHVPNIEISSVISWCACHEEFMNALLEDPRVKNSTELQRQLWAVLTESRTKDYRPIQLYYDKCAKVRMILEKRIMDPSIDSNFPLRRLLSDAIFAENERKIAQMLLDDDRVVLTLEPFDNNLISIAFSAFPASMIAKLRFILSHPKCKREWFERVMKYLLYEQSELATINNIQKLFANHEFDEFFSDELIEGAPKAIKQLQRKHPYYFNYFDDPGFYSDEEEANEDENESVDVLPE